MQYIPVTIDTISTDMVLTTLVKRVNLNLLEVLND